VSKGKLVLLLEASPLKVVQRVSSTAFPNEGGGILIGYRTLREVVVTHALEVPDHRADGRRYLRRRAPAQRVLDDLMSREPSSSLLGWVGEFHSHPADQPASQTDLLALRRDAVADGRPVALLIAARSGAAWRFFGYVATRWRCHVAGIVHRPSEERV